MGGAGTRGYDDRGAQMGMGGRNKPAAQNAGGRFMRTLDRNARQQQGNRGPYQGGPARREASVKAEPDWLLLEQFNLAELNKLTAVGDRP